MSLPSHVCPIEIIDGHLAEFPAPPSGFLGEAGKMLREKAQIVYEQLNAHAETAVTRCEVAITKMPEELGAKPGSLVYNYSLETPSGIFIGETLVLEPHELTYAPRLILPSSVHITEMPEIVEPVDDLVDAGGYRL